MDGFTEDVVSAFGNKYSSTAISERIGGGDVVSSACGGNDRWLFLR